MKRVILPILAVAALALLGGCMCDGEGQRRPNGNCVDFPEGGIDVARGLELAQSGDCDAGRCGRGLGGRRGEALNEGPETAAVTYPYYTIHGPRDFLQKSPTPIGP